MRMNDLIAKKRDGGALSREEIDFMVQGYSRGEIPDYQMSAMCMAILFQGMDDRETLDLTMAMMHSGDVIDLSAIEGLKGDKHSTGGVGDKTSLVLCPMVSACGVKVAKMSGRGLGHTGGTLDKLESFPGFRIFVEQEEFFANVNECGLSIIGQTANLVPADKKMYALRDVTATVPAVPLIVSSIMSKKLASGSDVIILDVKCGSGAFMKNEQEARVLAEGLCRVGRLAGRRCAAVITDMDQPLGNAVGNALEVKEAIAVLKGEQGGDVLELCLVLGSLMVVEAGLAGSLDEARQKLQKTIADGSALEKLEEMVRRQHGDPRAVRDVSLLPEAPVQRELPADGCGYVSGIDAEGVGLVAMHLGGGRLTKESTIDLSVGVVLHKKLGDRVEKGESLATIHAADEASACRAAEELRSCYSFCEQPVERPAFIKEIVR